MSAGTDLPPAPGRPDGAFTIAQWVERHRRAAARGGYLGDDFGPDGYVEGVVARFCSPHILPGARALEIGPGGGRYTERLLALASEVCAVDVSDEILAHLRARLGAPERLELRRGDGRTLRGVESGRFDFACSFNLFLFLEPEEICAYLSEIRRCLAPGGFGVVQYADLGSASGRALFERSRAEATAGARRPVRFRFLTKDFMARLLDSAGLEAVFDVNHGRDAFAGFCVRGGASAARHRAIARSATEAPRRPETTPPALAAAEAAWWKAYAAQADAVTWVQTASARRIVRGRYVRRIVASVPRCGTVLDYGCGTGWLSELLVSFGAGDVVGVDDAPEQIALANALKARSPFGKRLRFLLGADVPEGFRADVAVVHAVLHHLSWSEFRAVIARLEAAIVPGGGLWLLEPVSGDRPYRPWSVVPDALQAFFSTRGGARRASEEETALRARLAQSRTGPRLPGHGPSPKEMPFRLGEIEARIGPGFRLVSVEPALFRAHQVAAENLLYSATRPRLGHLLRGPALRLASAWERLSFRFRPAGSVKGWVFCLYRFERSLGPAPVTAAEQPTRPA